MLVEAMGIVEEYVGVYARKSVLAGEIWCCLRENQKSGGFPCSVPEAFTRFCILLPQSLLSLGRCPIAT
jgi:hypothetical protein